MLDLCSRKNQGAGAMQGQGATTQAALDPRQLVALHIEDRITVASENHINSEVDLEDIHRHQSTQGLRSETSHQRTKWGSLLLSARSGATTGARIILTPAPATTDLLRLTIAEGEERKEITGRTINRVFNSH